MSLGTLTRAKSDFRIPQLKKYVLGGEEVYLVSDVERREVALGTILYTTVDDATSIQWARNQVTNVIDTLLGYKRKKKCVRLRQPRFAQSVG